MQTRTRREAWLLAGLVCVLGALLWWNLGRPDEDAAAAPAKTAARRAAARTAGGAGAVPPVALDRLHAPPPEVQFGARDPFRFRADAPQEPPPPGPAPGVPEAGTPEAAAAAAASGPPQIPLKFIGTLERTIQHDRLAVLSDGRGNTFYGREGDIIEGRYRIVRIGVESIEMAYVDGRGQQTIRLSGS